MENSVDPIRILKNPSSSDQKTNQFIVIVTKAVKSLKLANDII